MPRPQGGTYLVNETALGRDDSCVWARAVVAGMSWLMCTCTPEWAPNPVPFMPVLCSALTFLFSEAMALVPLGCTDDSDFDKYVSKSIQNYGCHECDDVAFMLARLVQTTSSVVIDIGGNIGMYSLAAAAAGHHAIVFEPWPANVGKILASMRRNRFEARMHVVPLCATDEPEGTQSPCHLGSNPSNQGALRHRPLDRHGAGPPVQSSILRGPVTSAAVRIDDFIPPQPAIFLKLDVEGGERRALRGMTRLLNDSTAVVGALIEFDKLYVHCEELVSEGGAFAILHYRHGLCASATTRYAYAFGGSVVHPTSFADICLLQERKKRFRWRNQLNLRWSPCSRDSNNASTGQTSRAVQE